MKNTFARKISQYVDLNFFITSLLAFVVLMISLHAMASSVLINGAGSTFVEPIYTKWFSEYQKIDGNVSVNYQGIGSGGGIRQLIAGTVDFGASDSPMTAEEEKSAVKFVHHIPLVLGAVVVSYNLPVSGELKLDGPLVADIFSGKITKWNDERIAKINSSLKLPDLPIVVATRADGSGTTAVFTDYLAKVSPDWRGKAGKTADWFKGSLGAKGNAGVAGLIKQTEGAIGYVELVYARENKLPFALLQNKKGEFIEASTKTVSAAASGAKIVDDMVKNGFKLSITNSDNKNAYPISSFTWMLIYDGMSKDKGTGLLNLVKWTLSDKAQDLASQINYAPLPTQLRKKVLGQLEKVKLN
jgi:phosphate transport system substrate-binding protein